MSTPTNGARKPASKLRIEKPPAMMAVLQPNS